MCLSPWLAEEEAVVGVEAPQPGDQYVETRWRRRGGAPPPLSKWTAFSGNAFSARMRKLNFPHGLS